MSPGRHVVPSQASPPSLPSSSPACSSEHAAIVAAVAPQLYIAAITTSR